MADTDVKGHMIKSTDGSKIWVHGDEIKEVDPSKENLELAHKIVENFAEITKHDRGYDIDLIGIIGVRHEHVTQKKSEAIEAASHKVAVMLEKGELVLSDTWVKDNLEDVKELTDNTEKQ